jgi:phosphoribosylformimino-5-aminoimidazole carboxamide ribotide isomerase
MNVIPAIDLRGGRCVRLYQGEFDRETEYSADPAAVARDFAELGAERLHVVDLDGARGGTQLNRDIVRNLATESPLRVQLGGGIRDRQSLDDWLAAGVDRCVIGSLAVSRPDEVMAWLQEAGADRIVLALDVRIDEAKVPWLTTHGWRRTSTVTLWDCLEDYLAAGLRHVLCTDVSRDGAMSGPNLGLYGEIVSRYPTIALQASGGVRGLEDLEALRDTGAAAAITGRALLEGSLSKAEVRSFLLGE